MSKNVNQFDIKKILVIGRQLIGDAIMSLPSFKGLINHFHHAQFTVISSEATREIYTNVKLPHPIEFLPYKQSLPLRKQYDAIQLLRKSRFDMALCYPGSFNAALIAFLARIPIRIGIKGDYRSLLLTHKVRLNPSKMHQRDMNAQITALAQVPENNEEHCFSPSEEDQSYIDSFLSSKKLTHRNFIVINPSASDPKKAWQGFSELIKILLTDSDKHLLLIGAKDDLQISHSIMKAVNDHRLQNITGLFSLGETAALLQRARYYIGNNSGIMHLAAAVGCQTFSISGHSNLIQNRAWGEKHRHSSTDLFCCPCSSVTLKKCPHLACLNSITASDVLRMIQEDKNIKLEPILSLLSEKETTRQQAYKKLSQTVSF